jgi:signal transduction histidine kinase
MDPAISQSILQDRPIAYAITDRKLTVVEIYDPAGILSENHTASLGRSLLKLVPELIGSEEVLGDILDGKLPRFELDWVNRETKAGRTVYLAMVDLPYRGKEGRIAGLIHMVEDVTETGELKQRLTQQRNELRLLQRQLARQNLELAAANAELRRLDEMKTTFVSVAAHELRTPLTSIKGYTEVLMDEDAGPLNSVQLKYLQIVERAADRLLHITNSLLDVTRIETGRMELVLQPTDLKGLVEAVVTEHRPQLEAKAQRLELHVAPELPPALSDRTRAVQIIDNLLSNASKYTPRGGTITIRLAAADEAGFVQVSVSDNGLGIAEEDQSKLFSRFFRAGSAAEAEAGGTGLGLFITRSLVEQHGGRVWFESELNKGSTFHVTFPSADRPA